MKISCLILLCCFVAGSLCDFTYTFSAKTSGNSNAGTSGQVKIGIWSDYDIVGDDDDETVEIWPAPRILFGWGKQKTKSAPDYTFAKDSDVGIAPFIDVLSNDGITITSVDIKGVHYSDFTSSDGLKKDGGAKVRIDNSTCTKVYFTKDGNKARASCSPPS
mmetsp:Transcript_102444/g.153534  ORF Transcript_102444/g.153534 Transcript_102444/m.153534 type:complete len:161 (+) Transcript_102444:107-589(+)